MNLWAQLLTRSVFSRLTKVDYALSYFYQGFYAGARSRKLCKSLVNRAHLENYLDGHVQSHLPLTPQETFLYVQQHSQG